MPHNRAFAQVDVFSAEPFRGNPVAVILDAEGLSTEDMARIANWTNLSETTFVLPPSEPSDPSAPRADYRLRIFTPSRELPFAGHPTLGSAAAWLAAGGVPRDEGTVVQECGAGLVTLRRGGARDPLTGPTPAGDQADADDRAGTGVPAGTPEPETLSFAAPGLLRSGGLEEDHLGDIAAALHIDRSEILDHQWVDNGPGWAAVRLASAEQVLALRPDFSVAPDLTLGVVGAHPEDSAHEYEVRAFIPRAGVTEYPVTGSLNASLAQWLIGAGLAPRSYTATQGTALGRSGVITIDAEGDPDAPTIWVGGATRISITGTLFA